MSRVYQRTPSDAIIRRIKNAKTRHFYVLQEVGPMAFIITDEIGGEADTTKKYKVAIGYSHQCNCSKFYQDGYTCTHIVIFLLI
jgi:hypothetical protein